MRLLTPTERAVLEQVISRGPRMANADEVEAALDLVTRGCLHIVPDGDGARAFPTSTGRLALECDRLVRERAP